MTAGNQIEARDSAWNRFVRAHHCMVYDYSSTELRARLSHHATGQHLLMGGFETPRSVTTAAKDETP